jgi:DNA-binding XRE family transcriptional regulator
MNKFSVSHLANAHGQEGQEYPFRLRDAPPSARASCPDPNGKSLAHRTHELRKAKGWSQNKLTDFAGIARGYLSHILAGEYSPTLRILAQLTDALGVQVRDLFV